MARIEIVTIGDRLKGEAFVITHNPRKSPEPRRRFERTISRAIALRRVLFDYLDEVRWEHLPPEDAAKYGGEWRIATWYEIDAKGKMPTNGLALQSILRDALSMCGGEAYFLSYYSVHAELLQLLIDVGALSRVYKYGNMLKALPTPCVWDKLNVDPRDMPVY